MVKTMVFTCLLSSALSNRFRKQQTRRAAKMEGKAETVGSVEFLRECIFRDALPLFCLIRENGRFFGNFVLSSLWIFAVRSEGRSDG